MQLNSDVRAAPIAVSNALEKMSSQCVHDPTVGIRIATVLDDANCSYYATEIQPGKAIAPHYHCDGNEVYIIFSGLGAIKTWPPESIEDLTTVQVEKGDVFKIPQGIVHQLVNTGTQPLVLLFACPPQHLDTDRVMPPPTSFGDIA